MKRYLLLIVLLITTATGAWAIKGPQGVSGSWHDFSSVNPNPNWYTAANEDEVCIFCHTPHGGKLNTQLWNRDLPDANAFTHYSSATLSPTAELSNPTRPVNQESLLCLSCHDGTVAMNSLLNYSNSTGAQPNGGSANMILFMFGPGAVIGSATNASTGFAEGSTLLSDDHPISFSYTTVYDYNAPKNHTKLHDITAAESSGVRFFGATDRVECSSCHDPHVNYTASGNPAYAPFLITPNNGSALCLACHIK